MSYNNEAAGKSLGPAEQEILDISIEWGKAIVSNDAEAIGHFMSDDWLMISENGVCDKEKFLAFVASGDLTHSAMDTAEIARIKIYGDMAVTASRVTNTADYRDEAFEANEWTSDVFIKTDAGWKCSLTHITAVKEK